MSIMLRNSSPLSIGVPVIGGTPDSVLYIGPTGLLAQDNPAFTWDETENTLNLENSTTGSGDQEPNIALYNNGGGASEFASIAFYDQGKSALYWSIEIDSVHGWGANTFDIRNEGAGANPAWSHDFWTDNWLGGGTSVGFFAFDDSAGEAWGFQFSDNTHPAGLFSFFVGSFVGFDWDEDFNFYMRPNTNADHARLGIGYYIVDDGTPPYLLSVRAENSNNPPVIGIVDGSASDNLDPIVSYYHTTTHKWTHGVDRSDSDKWKVGQNADLSTPTITLDALKVGLNNASPTADFDMISNSTTTDAISIVGNSITTADLIQTSATGLTTGNVWQADATSTGAGAKMLDLDLNTSPSNSSQTGYKLLFDTSGSGTQTQDFVGINNQLKINNPGSQSTNQMISLLSDARFNSTGSATDITGIQGKGSIASISHGGVTLVTGVHALVDNDGQATLTTAQALLAEVSYGGSSGTTTGSDGIVVRFTDDTAASHTFGFFRGINIEAMSIASTSGSAGIVIGAITDTGTINSGITIGDVSGGGSNRALVTGAGDVIFGGRVQESQGADVASANDLTLGLDGNTFEITGTTQINRIVNTGWQNGSKVTFLFTSTPTVKHGQASGGVNITILLAGSVDFSATAGDTLTLCLCEIGGTQAWRELARTVI